MTETLDEALADLESLTEEELTSRLINAWVRIEEPALAAQVVLYVESLAGGNGKYFGTFH